LTTLRADGIFFEMKNKKERSQKKVRYLGIGKQGQLRKAHLWEVV
jgi:hypothetical protein